MGLVSTYLNGSSEYLPLAAFDGRRHLFLVFLLYADVAVGLLGEAWDDSEGEETIPNWAFTTLLPPALEVFLHLEGRRWDAGTSLVQSGNEPFPGLSKAKAKDLVKQRRVAVATSKDQLNMRLSAAGTAWDHFVGFLARRSKALFWSTASN